MGLRKQKFEDLVGQLIASVYDPYFLIKKVKVNYLEIGFQS